MGGQLFSGSQAKLEKKLVYIVPYGPIWFDFSEKMGF